MVLARFQVHQREHCHKGQRHHFASISTNASTKVRTTISDPSSGVTIDVVQKMLAERDAF